MCTSTQWKQGEDEISPDMDIATRTVYAGKLNKGSISRFPVGYEGRHILLMKAGVDNGRNVNNNIRTITRI